MNETVMMIHGMWASPWCWETIAEYSSVWLDKILGLKNLTAGAYVDQRSYKRIDYHAPIIFSGADLSACYQGRMNNCSSQGIHFTSDVSLRPGSDIQIKIIDKTYTAPGFQENEACMAEVIWSKERTEAHRCDMGARFS